MLAYRNDTGSALVSKAQFASYLNLHASIFRDSYFGSEEFKDGMVGLMESVGALENSRVRIRYYGTQIRDYGEAHARQVLKTGCVAIGYRRDELRLTKTNDEAKVLVTEIFASETTVRLGWLREELATESRSHCSRLINDQRKGLGSDKALQRKRSRILNNSKIK